MAGDIEYLDEPVDDVQTPGPEDRGRRRLLRPAYLLVLAGAVLVALLVTRAVSSDGRHVPPRPTPGYPLASCRGGDHAEYSVRAPAVGTAPGGTVSVPLNDGHPAGPVACSSAGASCPEADDGQNACRSAHTLPDAVVSAVRARFPGAQVVDTITETIRENGRLWYRYVHFRLPMSTDLAVEVVNGHPDETQTGEWDDGSGLFSRVASTHGSVTTVVTVDAPSGAASTLTTQIALARDRALAAR